MSLAYSMLAEEVLSKERFVPCSVRQELTDKFNLLSLVVAIGIPVVLGPVACPLIHVVLTLCSCCCCCAKCQASGRARQDQHQEGHGKHEEQHGSDVW